MQINAVSFSTGQFSGSLPTSTCPKTKSTCSSSEVKLKNTDIIPISGVIGAGLVSAYFMRKGQIDTFIKTLRF